jgi:hypothetical protein
MIRLNTIENPYSILDHILRTLKDTTEETPLNDLETLNKAGLLMDIGNRDKYLIIEKLKKDEYIGVVKTRIDSSNVNSAEEDRYFITFEGILFIRKDGYSKREEDKTLQIERKKAYDDSYLKSTQRIDKGTHKLVFVTVLLVVTGLLQAIATFMSICNK